MDWVNRPQTEGKLAKVRLCSNRAGLGLAAVANAYRRRKELYKAEKAGSGAVRSARDPLGFLRPALCRLV